ncbi:ROK family protein [uncultured Megasphaera sp.]|jgi:predicted NBD/HSP70 family sugar kinase|uniref:ROK family protein n=1 Tax=uncultured Megasphaera sp. TaxID=165188 RepID=UPI0025CF2F0F|nr:ROK family protein [uncultured Megasphaera sp.]
MIYSCFDIGGTAIKFGLLDETGRFHKKGSLPTEAQAEGGLGIVHKVRALIQRQLADHPLAGIAISTAGIINPQTGTVDYALSIPGYTGTKWKAILEDEFQLPCIVENDTNCAALGEWWLGAGREMDTLFAVTIGTSIGGAFIENGHILQGTRHAAGEIAYMHIPAGRLHDVASATYLCRETARQKAADPEKVDGYKVFQLVRQGDSSALAALDAFCQNLADGLANIACLCNPDGIVLGGGIMAQEEILRPRLEKALAARLPAMMLPPKGLAFAKRQNDAGMLGALYLLLHQKTGPQ